VGVWVGVVVGVVGGGVGWGCGWLGVWWGCGWVGVREWGVGHGRAWVRACVCEVANFFPNRPNCILILFFSMLPIFLSNDSFFKIFLVQYSGIKFSPFYAATIVHNHF